MMKGQTFSNFLNLQLMFMAKWEGLALEKVSLLVVTFWL